VERDEGSAARETVRIERSYLPWCNVNNYFIIIIIIVIIIESVFRDSHSEQNRFLREVFVLV
jgi:hypothetical protein